MKNIQMVDLISQYENIKTEVDKAVIQVMSTARFIKGPKVSAFEVHLSEYLGVKYSIACAMVQTLCK